MRRCTFVIPCFNEVEFTKKTVESIFKNSPQGSFNFVFIDNGSTDDTPNYLSTVPDSIVIRNETNIYVNPAWNQGFKYVLEHDLGEYVCLCNNDIEAGTRWLDPIFKLFEQGRQEWYIPVTNTQEGPEPFHDSNGFHDYCNKLSTMPLRLFPIQKNFIGFCMFIRKEYIKTFYPVPEQMKILRGDDWLTDSITCNNILCFRVSHCAAWHCGSATQQSLDRQNNGINAIREKDSEEFNKLFETEYKKRKWTRIYDHKFSIKLL